jgi:hypothetical protein
VDGLPQGALGGHQGPARWHSRQRGQFSACPQQPDKSRSCLVALLTKNMLCQAPVLLQQRDVATLSCCSDFCAAVCGGEQSAGRGMEGAQSQGEGKICCQCCGRRRAIGFRASADMRPTEWTTSESDRKDFNKHIIVRRLCFVQQSLLKILTALCIGKACRCCVTLQTLVLLTKLRQHNTAHRAAVCFHADLIANLLSKNNSLSHIVTHSSTSMPAAAHSASGTSTSLDDHPKA